MKFIPLLVVAGVVFACSTKNQETRALSFEMKSFHQESDGGCGPDSVACAKFEVNYPLFSPLNDGGAMVLNKNLLAAIYAPDSSSTLEKKAKAFIGEFEEERKTIPGSSGWYYNSVAEVLLLSDTLVSVRCNEDYFSGGAHGGSSTQFINVAPATGKKFMLLQALKPGYEMELNKIGERFFREARKLSPQADLEEAGFDFRGDFKLNENYGFRKEGIVFVFNSYEIGAYALGPTEFMIPYEEIKQLLVSASDPQR